MYIESASITNIRSINKFKLNFKTPVGWHVIIGDNGAGKSTIIKSLALALVGPEQIKGLSPAWNEWLRKDSTRGNIKLYLDYDENDEQLKRGRKVINFLIKNEFTFSRKKDLVIQKSNSGSLEIDPMDYNWGSGSGWFSAGFGPMRRFSGGSRDKELIFDNPTLPRLASHLSLFGEDVALTEATRWLMYLRYQVYEKKINKSLLENIKKLINSPDFLPHNAKLAQISSDGVVFTDGNNVDIPVTQMSDGYRSILSLTFELIRQVVRVYGEDRVFKNIEKDLMNIDIPGVVLIDEVDAHLHPSWQTKIGEWFTKYFPNMQFIVTTHSPLICRACGKGTIWRLASPGSKLKSSEVKGIDREKLIDGNILDAFGTEIFGSTPVRSEKSNEKLELLGKLNMLSALGKISQNDEKERLQLQKILTTNDPTGFKENSY